MFWRMDAGRGGEGRSSESGLDPSAGGRAARCGAAGKDLDNYHAAAAARAWRTMIGRGVRIGGVVHCGRINLRHWSRHQLPGARAAGYSPDRLDALVWATTELLVEPMKGGNVFELYRRQAAARAEQRNP